MFKLSRRKLLLSSAALAAGAGLKGAFAQSDVTANLKLQGFGGDAELAADHQCGCALQQEVSERHRRNLDRPDQHGLGRLRHQGASASSMPAPRPTSTARRSRPSRLSRRAACGSTSTISCSPTRLLGLCAEPVRAGLLQGGDPVRPDRLEQHHDQLQPRPVRQGRASPIPSRAGRGTSSARSPRSSRSRTAPAPSPSSATRCRTRISSSSPGSSPTAPACSTTTGRRPTCSTPRSPRACSSCTTSSMSTASRRSPARTRWTTSSSPDRWR